MTSETATQPAGPVPQVERTRQARLAILAAAAELFGQRGYVETSLAMVGLKAGYSRGIVAYHFGSKEALAHAVIDHIAEKNRVLLQRSIEGKTGLAAYDAAVDYYCSAVLARPSNAHAINVLSTVAATSAPELREHVAEHNAWLRSTIADILRSIAADQNSTVPSDLDLRAGMIEGVLRGLTQQYFVDPDRFDLKAAAATLKGITRGGILSG